MAFIGSGKSSQDYTLSELKEEMYSGVIRSIETNKVDFSRSKYSHLLSLRDSRRIHIRCLIAIKDRIDACSSIAELRDIYFNTIAQLIA